jgi:hypothetical protein
MCVLILLYLCPHTTTYVSAYVPSVLIAAVDPTGVCYFTVCVLILLYVCPHTTICVLMLLHTCPHTCRVCSLLLSTQRVRLCPRTTVGLSAYCYICVLILLHVCPHTAISVSACALCDSRPYRCILFLVTLARTAFLN